MFIDGRLALTAANTPTPLVSPTGASPAKRITNIALQASRENSGAVFIGGPNVVSTPVGSRTGIALYPGDTESFSATDASDIYVAGAIGDAVRFRAKAL